MSGRAIVTAPTNVGYLDWLARSTAQGVTSAYGFDDNQVFTGYTSPNTGAMYLGRGGDGKIVGSLSDNTPGGYGKSLKMTAEANFYSVNMAGSFTATDPPYLFNAAFGPSGANGQTFYVQFRVYIEQAVIDNWAYWGRAGQGVKVSNIHKDPGHTADYMEITLASPYNRGPMADTEAGSFDLATNGTDPYFNKNEVGTVRLQSGWDLTSGPSWTNEPNAIVSDYPGPYTQWPTNEWLTIQHKVYTPTLYSDYQLSGPTADGTLEIWMKRQSERFWRKFSSVKLGWAYNFAGGGPTDSWQSMYLSGLYITSVDQAAPQDASIYFDELIISSQPIAMPAVG